MRSAEDASNRLLLDVRHQMTVTPALFLGRMPRPVVDDPLIDTRSGQATDERVTLHMVAAQNGPLAATQGTLEVVMRLIAGHGRRCLHGASAHARQPAFER